MNVLLCTMESCKRPHWGRGYCKKHYDSERNAGRLQKRMALTPEEAFWAKVEKQPNGGCWLWVGYLTPSGYGRLWFHGKNAKAHRVAWELLRGNIPKGMTPDHLCRVRRCVNPDHIEIVTPRENILRGIGITAQSARKNFCLRGHELAGKNLCKRPDGHRACRICRNRILQPRRRMKVALRKLGVEP